MRHFFDDESVQERDLRPTSPVNSVTVTNGRHEPVEGPGQQSAPARLFSAAKRHFFGNAKKVSAATFAGKAAELRDEMAREERRRAAAARLLADPAFLSDDVHAKAEADLASALRTKVRLAGQISQVEADLALQEKVEAEEAFSRRAEQVRKQGQEVERRFKAEYPAAAKSIGDLMSALVAFNQENSRLADEGKALGLVVDIVDPMAFRNATSPEHFSASWPNVKPRARQVPDRVTKIDFERSTASDEDDFFRAYDHVISGSAEDAPAWAIRWVDGRPEPLCEGVEISSRGRTLAHALSTVCLPGLMWNDKPFVTPAS